MNHLQMYTELWLMKQRHPEPESDDCYNQMSAFTLAWGSNKYLTKDQLKEALNPSAAPKPSQLIPHLISLGYKQKHLAEIFHVSPANISYHNAHPSKEAYENETFLYHFDGVYKFRKNKRVYYKSVHKNPDVNE